MSADYATFTATRRDAQLIANALLHTLRQLGDILCTATDAQYVQNPVGVIAGSLGGHVRHCLDHFDALLLGHEHGIIDYDQRDRGTPIETDRRAALAAIARFSDRLPAACKDCDAGPIRVRSLVAADGTAIESESSFERELVFVLSHTIHHNALIAAICRTLGISLPHGFGYAPSTLAHISAQSCVPSQSFR